MGTLSHALLFVLLVAACQDDISPPSPPGSASQWSATELATLRSLSLTALPDRPPSLSNRVADDARAAELGRRLFFDPGLSRNGKIACTSCHFPELYFTDGRRTSTGLATGNRNALSVIGAAYSPWLFWDGRRDSLWAQALAPIESADEMGSTRLAVVRYVSAHPEYQGAYRGLFGPPPDLTDPARFPEQAGPFGGVEARAAWARLSTEEQDEINRAFSNIGKAIAAYERRLAPAPARFDRFVEALSEGDTAAADETLSPEEKMGLRLFIDGQKTQCLRCHNGPLFTNNSFHDIGTGRRDAAPDLGRFLGLQSLRLDIFNCLGPYSDAPPQECRELRFLDRRGEARQTGAFRTPSLRNVAKTSPYFHDGSLIALDEIIDYYRAPPQDPPNELVPTDLNESQARQLVAFLATLSGGFVELDH